MNEEEKVVALAAAAKQREISYRAADNFINTIKDFVSPQVFKAMKRIQSVTYHAKYDPDAKNGSI